MSVQTRFIISLSLIFISSFTGYFANRKKLLPESVARQIMNFVAVVGYPSVGFMAIWQMSIKWSDAWLPLFGGLQATLTALFALWIAKRLFTDREEQGLIGISCGIGNHGVTMAGFVVYLLFGDKGLGLNTIYALYTFFALVLLSYTIAQAYSEHAEKRPILRLMLENLLHWRAMGLYACIAAIMLSVLHVPPAPVIKEWHLIDIVIYLVIILAYFSIGLRLHLPHIGKMKKAILSVMLIRHIGGLTIGAILLGITMLTPWPLTGMALKVFIIQSSVSSGVLGVAVANMFNLKPGEASAIFVVSSLFYLIVMIPLLLIIFA